MALSITTIAGVSLCSCHPLVRSLPGYTQATLIDEPFTAAGKCPLAGSRGRQRPYRFVSENQWYCTNEHSGTCSPVQAPTFSPDGSILGQWCFCRVVIPTMPSLMLRTMETGALDTLIVLVMCC
jgi:hypothetical protein